MATVEITDDNFREIYQNNEIVILDFWAAWCGPCRQFGPIFEEASECSSDVLFGKIDTENQQKLAAYFQIRSIPTVIVIREQLEVYRNSGVLGSNDLKMILEKVRNADMDMVRKEFESESD